ncbi:nucleotidyltransferase family protein [Magnetospirillum molischianum]|uniref:Putative Nucleotidyl transferase family protein putative Mannose-1-phosphate guanyltransferase n=1 Tax=Magnetospirillum molischianum DSM 120 TaxID=1150626 RepID=H8FUH4_MAGML|nr:nucleotidyltransferase family protein [Magnetospirillum molischianum]CCG42012.1 Putative Nucleotidyl transferase family protein; putative Mannose-1-phosphate guanyltransferase [Magnetospirillum molischianum DSM 120]
MTVPFSHAMVLAAGLGLRMRPITLTVPKPLVAVAGRTMLDRAIDALDAAGVTRIVVNCHWLGEKIRDHLAGRPDIALSPEDELLETGGGVTRALPLLGDAPFFVVNADILWTEGAVPALERLRAAWEDERMDALLLLHPTTTAVGHDGPGDFTLDSDGLPHRRGNAAVAPYLFTGVQILHPRLFEAAPEGRFSLNVLYDRALSHGRLAAIVHDGGWFHVGTPEALPSVEARLRA